MTALTGPRKTVQLGAAVEDFDFDVKASAIIFAGALVLLASGYAIPGKTGADSTEAGTFQCVGVAQRSVTGGASDGAVTVKVRQGMFGFKNSSAGDLITRSEIGKVCYVVDDQTVAKTSATNTRAVAGRIKLVDADGTVWVTVGPGLAA
jgi:hypothetical protein